MIKNRNTNAKSAEIADLTRGGFWLIFCFETAIINTVLEGGTSRYHTLYGNSKKNEFSQIYGPIH